MRILNSKSSDATFSADAESSYTGTASTFRPPIPEKRVQLTGYRYYSPEIGRWLSRDPIGEKGGVFLYGYVLNGPIGRVDLLGMDCCCCCLSGPPSITVSKKGELKEGEVVVVDPISSKKRRRRGYILTVPMNISVPIQYKTAPTKRSKFSNCKYTWREKAIFFPEYFDEACDDGSWCDVTDEKRKGNIPSKRVQFPQEFDDSTPPNPCDTESTNVADADYPSVRIPKRDPRGTVTNRINFEITVEGGVDLDCDQVCTGQQKYVFDAELRLAVSMNGTTRVRWKPKDPDFRPQK